MAIIPYISSLMEFNRRVLSQGDIPEDYHNLETADLKQMLFFNSVFIGNTTEMYQKYPMETMDTEYVESLNVYIRNVDWVMNMFSVLNPSCKMTTSVNFEARLAATSMGIDDQLIHGLLSKDFKYDHKTIYYFSILPDGVVAVSFIDPNRSAYHAPIKHQFSNSTTFYKTDEVIRDIISRTLGTNSVVAMRITANLKTNQPSKIEFNGNHDVMRRLLKFFPSTCLVVSNPFIYTDDIKEMIESVLPSKIIVKPDFVPFDFSTIFLKDKLIEFPNESFDEYLQFLRMAVNNSDTEAIYLTLYRIGNDPAIFYILRDAIRRNIKVHVNIELMASGEYINKVWLQEMLSVGIKVTTYALGELKVHTKLTLIKFSNNNMVAQIGTGNYHTKTTSQYTDLCLITSDISICAQVLRVFKMFDGKEKINFADDFLVTRYNARDELKRLIRREANRQGNGYILIKCNALDDPEIINELEAARHMGCYIYAIIRGVCTWVPKDSPNVTIKSVIWDKLEHSRVYCFGKTNPVVYMGSLDLVTHKLDKRIENLVKIKDPDVLLKVVNYLNRYVTNTKESWIQTSSGIYFKEN